MDLAIQLRKKFLDCVCKLFKSLHPDVSATKDDLTSISCRKFFSSKELKCLQYLGNNFQEIFFSPFKERIKTIKIDFHFSRLTRRKLNSISWLLFVCFSLLFCDFAWIFLALASLNGWQRFSTSFCLSLFLSSHSLRVIQSI